MNTTGITSEVTRCERDTLGVLVALGGNGWLIESNLAAADIAATGPTPGPYFVVSPDGQMNFLTVSRSTNDPYFALSTDHGDQPLVELPASQTC